tara:strand:- start:101 stop:400 length:300 start_codon:yes stop_codon:yes gene_type:complete
MDIQESTLVFKLDERDNFSGLNIKSDVKNFIADFRGTSVDVTTKITNKLITFGKSISENKGSFVIVCDYLFNDELIIVPTLQEAYDYIEMEEIERQLEL